MIRPWEGSGDAEAGPATATVEGIRAGDGDTIEVELDCRREDVRLIGVDTPETVAPGEPVQCFGPPASAFTHEALDGRRARLLFGVERRDPYDRLLAYVHRGDLFVNAELLRRGLARTLTIPPNDRFAGRFERIELSAARAGRGLWGACTA